MHELSIALSLIDAASEEAARQGPVSVRALHVRVGALAGVVPSALAFAFDLAAAGTAVAGARLEIEHVPLTIRCDDCGAVRTQTLEQGSACATCGAAAEVVAGRELELFALEVVDVDPCGNAENRRSARADPEEERPARS